MANNGEGTDPDADAQSTPGEVTGPPDGDLPTWEIAEETGTGQVAAGQPPPYVPPVQEQPEAPWAQQQESTQQWHQPVVPPPDAPPAPPQAPPVGEPAPPPAQPPPVQPLLDRPTDQQQGHAPGSWTVPGSPPTTQQPIVGQPLGQGHEQYQQQYQPQQHYQQPYAAQQQYQPPYGAQQQPAAPTGPTRGGGLMAFLGGLLLVLGGAAMIAGSFLDWGEGLVGGDKVILTGFENAQGNLWGAPGTLAAGAVLVIAGVFYFASLKSGVGALKRTLALVAGLAGLGWVVYLLVSLQLDEANALIGLWLCLAGAVVGLVGTFLGRGKKAAAAPKT